MATIKPAADFDADACCEKLRKAMKGFGTDEDAIIEVLTNIDSSQRVECEKHYKSAYGKSLVDQLKGELRGEFEDAVVALMCDPCTYAARICRGAMKGIGTDEELLIETLCPRSPEEIEKIKAAYAEEFKRDLEADVSSEMGGKTKRILVSILQGNRPTGDDVDPAKAATDAQTLFEAGEGSWGTDESAFMKVFMLNSNAQIREILSEYRKLSDYDLEHAIEKEMGGDLQAAFKALVQAARSPALYFANKLHDAMAGVGSDEDTMTRIIIGRCEVDMEGIKEAFLDKYGKKLSAWVKGECGGDLRKLYLALIKE